MAKENVILTDSNDNEIGIEEKMKAHLDGKLHRAFSVFIFDSKGRMLIHRRAESKYHCGGLWTNTCCSHPRPGERVEQAAHRRLKEEMGFDCELKKIFSFVYKTKFDNGLTENEYDHVFLGKFDGNPKPDSSEVCDWKFVDINELVKDMKKNPDKYTYWFKQSLERVISSNKI